IMDASIVTAFNAATIGTRVDRVMMFRALVAEAVEKFDFTKTRIPGQGVITLPDEAVGCVLGGMGRHTGNPDHYVIRKHWSGQVHLYLKRGYEMQPKGVSVVVNTREAYLADPDVKNDAEEMH